MMIEDAELRSLYEVASSQHLANLEAGLLFLENHPQDRGKLEELLRIAHSLKGDSRMLGVTDAETLTHSFEELLSSVYKGETTPSEPVFAALFAGLDGIKRIAREATSGEPADVSVFYLVAEMMAVIGEQTASTVNEPAHVLPQLPPEISGDDLEVLLTPAQDNLVQTETTKPIVTAPEIDKIDTITIDASKLDVLAQYAGEVTVTQQRLSSQLTVVTNLVNLLEQAVRDHGQKQQTVLEQIGKLLPQLYTNLETGIDRLQVITDQLEQDIRGLQLLPFSTIFSLFPRTVRDIAKQQNKDINFVILGEDSLVDRKILEEIKSPLGHLIRNAVDHGIEPPQERIEKGKSPQGQLILQGTVVGNQIIIEVSDDGRGLNLQMIGNAAIRKGLITQPELVTMSPEAIQQLIFRPSFSTKTEVSEISGRGVGLDAVKAAIDRLQGEIKIVSKPDLGTTFKLILRANRSVIPVLVVRHENSFLALPADSVVMSLVIDTQGIQTLEGKPIIIWQDQPVPIIFLADYLQQTYSPSKKSYSCVILKIENRLQGLIVSEVVDFQEVQIKPHLLPIPQLLGVTILADGSICYVLNPLIFGEKVSTATTKPAIVPTVELPRKLLLVEDSIPIRTQLRRILEGAGYAVAIAVDGADGLQKFNQEPFDAIVSDVEMPNLSGIEMTERIRASNAATPIVLVTTLAKDSDRERGLKAGANVYLTKGDFDQSLLLNTLKELIK